MNKYFTPFKSIAVLAVSVFLHSNSIYNQTLQTVTNSGGNNTTNPIVIGSNTIPAAMVEVFHNGASTFVPALVLQPCRSAVCWCSCAKPLQCLMTCNDSYGKKIKI